MPSGRRAVPALLTLATLIPAAALAWLGFRVLDQDRALEVQRRREKLVNAAERVALGLERRLARAEEDLSRGSAPFRFKRSGVEGNGLLYQPAPVRGSEISYPAEALEFQRRDLPGAAAAYRAHAKAAGG